MTRRAVLPAVAAVLVAAHRYRCATTSEFVALARRVSGRDLGAFFLTWLHTPVKPTSW